MSKRKQAASGQKTAGGKDTSSTDTRPRTPASRNSFSFSTKYEKYFPEFERRVKAFEKAGGTRSEWIQSTLAEVLEHPAGESSPDPQSTNEILFALQELQTQVANQSPSDMKPSLEKISNSLAAIERQQSQLQTRLATAFAAVLGEGGQVDPAAAKAWAKKHFE